MLHNISDIGARVDEPEVGQRVKVVVKGEFVRMDSDGEMVITPDGTDGYDRKCIPVEGKFKVLGEDGESGFTLGGVYRDAVGDVVVRTATGWYDVSDEVARSDSWASRPLTRLASPNA